MLDLNEKKLEISFHSLLPLGLGHALKLVGSVVGAGGGDHSEEFHD